MTMAVHRWADLKAGLPAARRAKIDRRVREETLKMALAQLRQMTGKTQTELAKIMKVTQGRVSEAEHRGDHLLSTLRSYVKALGGELEVIANFGDKRIRLHV